VFRFAVFADYAPCRAAMTAALALLSSPSASAPLSAGLLALDGVRR
jgi:hypothetical protein